MRVSVALLSHAHVLPVFLRDVYPLLRDCFPDLHANDDDADDADGELSSAEALSNCCGFFEPTACLWVVARLNGDVVGAATVCVVGQHSAYVANVCVAQRLRGRRVASLMLRVASGAMLQRGVSSLVGSVAAQHPDAERLVALYRKLGATIDTSRSMSSSAPVTYRMCAAITWAQFHLGMAEFIDDAAELQQCVDTGVFDDIDVDGRRRRKRLLLAGAVLLAATVALLVVFKSKSRQR
jgi:ribosomal protein S18 acetylase RimI-like enzyme